MAQRRRRARWPGDDAARVERVRQRMLDLLPLSDARLDGVRIELQAEAARHGLTPGRAEACCALAAEVARRVLRLQAHDGQLLAALCMLDGCLAELPAGEGKSLAIALAAAMGALCGTPVHVLTASDHLVERDARRFEPLFSALGLTAAPVVSALSPEQRGAAYACKVVYVTPRELALDYLRDTVKHPVDASPLVQRVAALLAPKGERLLQGLYLALIDEADSILIDRGQVPLVLSREVEGLAGRAYTWQAWSLSGRLVAGDDYELFDSGLRVELTAAGRAQLERFADALKPAWLSARHREQSVLAALTARHVLQRDRDYNVEQPARGAAPSGLEVRIVYAATGRVVDGRRWSDGLHEFVCLKEGCRVEPEREVIGRITVQSFLRGYQRLGGTSGTLREARGELARNYGLAVVPIARRLPSRRVDLPPRAFVNSPARWQAVVGRCQEMIAAGRPVLVGTDCPLQALELSACLDAAGIDHCALASARGDAADEASLVAAAGASGSVTIATSLAGRGSGIELDAAALRAGGLHVICCQHNPTRRLDREFIGRAGRRGQPGSSEIWLALDTPPFCSAVHWRAAARLLVLLAAGPRVRLHPRGLRSVVALLQWLDRRGGLKPALGGGAAASAQA